MSSTDQEPRSFELADILTVTTPHLFSRNLIDGLKALLEFMTGAELHPWTLTTAATDCAPELIRQHPFLAELQPPDGTDKADLMAWLTHTEHHHPTLLPVRPLPSWAAPDPLTALIDRIELVNLPTTENPR